MATAESNLFLSLLPDVRNIIYDLVFREPDGLHLDFDADRPLLPSGFFALTQTCRQIRDECHDLPFWLNAFHFHVPVLSPARSDKQCSAAELLTRSKERCQKKRKLDLPVAYSLSESRLALRQTAREFVTAAMRLPHVDEMLSRFDRLVDKNPDVLCRMAKIHLHLGSQIDNVFVARFVGAWTQLMPSLRRMRVARIGLRVFWKIRVSSRLIMDCDCDMSTGLKYRLLRLNDWLDMGEELTLPELSTVNAVSTTVREALAEKPTADRGIA